MIHYADIAAKRRTARLSLGLIPGYVRGFTYPGGGYTIAGHQHALTCLAEKVAEIGDVITSEAAAHPDAAGHVHRAAAQVREVAEALREAARHVKKVVPYLGADDEGVSGHQRVRAAGAGAAQAAGDAVRDRKARPIDRLTALLVVVIWVCDVAELELGGTANDLLDLRPRGTGAHQVAKTVTRVEDCGRHVHEAAGAAHRALQSARETTDPDAHPIRPVGTSVFG